MFKNVLHILCVSVGILRADISNSDRIPAKWSVNILHDKVSVSHLRDEEPGFDLKEEEIQKFKLWKHGIVPFYIDTISFDKVLRDRIRNFLEVTSGLSGLQFLELLSPPLDEETRWAFFINRRGILECADHNINNFTNVGVQKVILGYDCITNGGLAEVVLLLAGVPPQHNSPNRDEYITVNMANILPDKKYLYQKLQDRDWLFHDLDYDFTSAGHYHFHRNTIDGTATIKPVEPVEVMVGEGDGFSYSDILKIRMLYNHISKKPHGHAKGSDCKKLFKAGSKLAAYNPKKGNELKPRKKPSKYLGVPNDDAETENAKNNDGNDVDQNEYANVNNEENDENDGNTEPVKSKSKMNLKGDPLTMLSDYETDDGRNKAKKHRGIHRKTNQ